MTESESHSMLTDREGRSMFRDCHLTSMDSKAWCAWSAVMSGFLNWTSLMILYIFLPLPSSPVCVVSTTIHLPDSPSVHVCFYKRQG
jgi:hypothetical protein